MHPPYVTPASARACTRRTYVRACLSSSSIWFRFFSFHVARAVESSINQVMTDFITAPAASDLQLGWRNVRMPRVAIRSGGTYAADVGVL
jgi:hypothetical protein